jgi:hypothetical protein
MARPLAGRPVRSRTIEALAATTATTPAIDDLLERLRDAAAAYAVLT